MKQSIADRLSLFVSNSQTATREFRWRGGSGQCRRLMALIYALEDKTIDSDAIKESHAIIRSNTRMFSKFRGLTAFTVAAKLSLSDNPEQLFDDTLVAYDRIREARLNNTDQLTIAAFFIASNTERYNFKNIATRAKRIQDGAQNRWWALAGHDDSIFSTMLALTDMLPSVAVERIGQLHEQLKPEFRGFTSGNVQALSQVLALSEKSDEALDCLLKLNKALRSKRIRFDKEFTLPMLGILSLLSVDDITLADDILSARDYLRQQRGFRSVSAQELLLLSAAIISSVYAEEIVGDVMASTTASVVNIIIAQQIAIMIAIAIAASVSTSAAAASA